MGAFCIFSISVVMRNVCDRVATVNSTRSNEKWNSCRRSAFIMRGGSAPRRTKINEKSKVEKGGSQSSTMVRFGLTMRMRMCTVQAVKASLCGCHLIEAMFRIVLK